jgi:hypothetical protein
VRLLFQTLQRTQPNLSGIAEGDYSEDGTISQEARAKAKPTAARRGQGRGADDTTTAEGDDMKTLCLPSRCGVKILSGGELREFPLYAIQLGDLLLTEVGVSDGAIDAAMMGRVTDVQHSGGKTTITYHDPLSLIRKVGT